MKNYNRTHTHGFTLIELTIVMLILVALAGIMVPMFGGFTDRAHNSAAAANVSEIAKQIELYNAKTQQGYPNQFDNLASAGVVWTQGVGGNTVGISPAAGNLMSVHTLTDKEATSIINCGINKLTDASKNTDNATFHVFNLATDLLTVSGPTGGTATTIAIIPAGPTGLQSEGVGLQNADTTKYFYMIVGLGQSCTAVGNVMVAAPVHYDTIDPAVFYQRYCAIFQVPLDANPNAGAPAKIVGVIGVHDAGFAGLDEHIKDYNQDVNTGN